MFGGQLSSQTHSMNWYTRGGGRFLEYQHIHPNPHTYSFRVREKDRPAAGSRLDRVTEQEHDADRSVGLLRSGLHGSHTCRKDKNPKA